MADFWGAIPTAPGREQDDYIYAAHHDGLVEHTWYRLDLGRVRLIVSARAASVAGRRLRYSARCQSRVAALLQAHLLTSTLSMMIWRNAEMKLTPCPLGNGNGGPAPDMALVSSWERHDAMLDVRLRDVPSDALVAGEGKDWILSSALWSSPGRAANYGWHRIDGRPIQPVGTAHDPSHSDYSQLGRWVASECLVDNVPATFSDAVTGKLGEAIASYVGGPLPAAVPPWELT